MNRHDTILRRDDALLLVIDFQQKIADAMEHRDSVSLEIQRLVQGMKILGVPFLVTEQYRKGLGPTVEMLTQEFGRTQIAEKMTFSCCGNKEFWTQLRETKRSQVIVTGIETHVCVLQTVLDLMANGYQVHLPVSATCSRADTNRDNAFSRMEKAGAILTNTESVFFELLTESGTEDFKSLRKLIV